MEPTKNSKYIATPAKVFMTIAIVLTVVIMLQAIIVEMAMTFTRSSPKPATKQAKEPTEEEKRLSRIQYSLKQCLPDGTIHLVRQPGRMYYYQFEQSSTEQIYDVNDNLLWEGAAKNSPYKYLSWTVDGGGDSFRAWDMRMMQMISPDACRTLDIPVTSKAATVQIWRYIPWRQSFVGYKTGGGKIGYAGATGFVHSKSQARPLGKFGSLRAWCPEDSTSPILLWQTSRSIYEINFEKRKVELLFESPQADIDRLTLHTWGSFRPRRLQPVEGYRHLIHCRTTDRKDYLIMRNPSQKLNVKTSQDWSEWQNNYCRFTATEKGVFMNRQWVDAEPPPKNFASSKDGQKWWRNYRAKPKKHWTELYKVDDQGDLKLLNKYGWTPPAESAADLAVSTRLAYAWQKTQRCVSQFSPPLYDLLWHIPGVRIWRSDYNRNRNEIVRETLLLIEQLRPGTRVWNFVIGALMVGFAAWHNWPRRTSRPRFIFWLVLVALFNLAGLLTYLALNHTPVIKCPACDKRRGLARTQCVRCQDQLPAPKPGKLDLIFDTQTARAT
ncbi:MAG: hypothetical protein ISS79_04780 [Phycisphaerae bacterium]|nr:hypothetical protein [Phycisphaerae bacterium]